MARSTSVCLALALFGGCVVNNVNGKKICSTALTALSGEDFSTLNAALTTAFGPLDEFDGLPDKSVIVAPNNEAFAAALKALNLTPEELLANTELLTTVLQDHVATVGADGSITDLNGHPVKIMVDGKDVPLSEAAKAKSVMIDDEGGNAPVPATTPISCFGGNQLIFPANAVITPKAEEMAEEKTPGGEDAKEMTEEKTPGGEDAREMIEGAVTTASSATSLAAGVVAAAMGLVATVF